MRSGQRRRAPLIDTLRSRVPSGFHLGGLPLHEFIERIDSLGELLDGLGDAWASGPTAAALMNLDGYVIRPPFHVLVLRRRSSIQRVGHVVHTTTELPPWQRAQCHGLATTSAVRTLVDIAASGEPGPRLTAALDSVLRDRLSTEDALHRQLAAWRSRGHRGVGRLLDIIDGAEVTRGGHSWLERRFLELVHEAGLPRPDMQQVVARRGDRLVRVDCRFPGTNIVVELLGHRFHRSRLQMQVDTERANAMAAAGLVLLQFTYLDVVERPEYVIATVSAMLASARTAAPAPAR
jgi:very-short-patch-repair endonuclease